MKKQYEEEDKLKAEQTPSIVQIPNRKSVKLGQTVTISVETSGGLLPITYSGAVSYVIENGYERNSIVYKWTPDKKQEPGVYEFSINAKSASGKTGRHILAIEILAPEPEKVPIVQQKTRKTKGFDYDVKVSLIDRDSIQSIKGV